MEKEFNIVTLKLSQETNYELIFLLKYLKGDYNNETVTFALKNIGYNNQAYVTNEEQIKYIANKVFKKIIN